MRHFGRGLHFSGYQRPNLDFDIVTGFMAHAALDFFKDFDVLGPEISKFLLARRGLGECGVGGRVGTGQMSWNIC